jgi:hypothetical protein
MGDVFTDTEKGFDRGRAHYASAEKLWLELQSINKPKQRLKHIESLRHNLECAQNLLGKPHYGTGLQTFLQEQGHDRIIEQQSYEYEIKFSMHSTPQNDPYAWILNDRYVLQGFQQDESTLYYFGEQHESAVIIKKGEKFLCKEKQLSSFQHPRVLKRSESVQEITLDAIMKRLSSRPTYRGFLEETTCAANLVDLSTGRIFEVSMSKVAKEGNSLHQMEVEYQATLSRFPKHEGTEQHLVQNLEDAAAWISTRYKLSPTRVSKYEFLTGAP